MTQLLVDRGLDEDWRNDALCAQVDNEPFFPEKGGSTRDAKKVCLECTVREDCLQFALNNDERFGIWGGLSERERRKLKRTMTPTPAPTPTLHTAPEEAPAMTTCRKCLHEVPVLVDGSDVCIRCDAKLEDHVIPQPAYADQIVAVMAASEGHHDPAVRAARKVVANALVALNKALRGETPTPLTAVPALPRPSEKKTWARANNSGRIAERVAALGVTSRDIRAWALAQRFSDVPTRGAIPERLVDAYEAAHKAAS